MYHLLIIIVLNLINLVSAQTKESNALIFEEALQKITNIEKRIMDGYLSTEYLMIGDNEKIINSEIKQESEVLLKTFKQIIEDQNNAKTSTDFSEELLQKILQQGTKNFELKQTYLTYLKPSLLIFFWGSLVLMGVLKGLSLIDEDKAISGKTIIGLGLGVGSVAGLLAIPVKKRHNKTILTKATAVFAKAYRDEVL